MKKALIAGMFFGVCTICFAQNTQSIDVLINEGLNKNSYLIQEELASFSVDERLDIYHQYRKNVWLGGLINFIPPLFLLPNFGIGNFIYKDYLGGIITLTGTVLGSGMLLSALNFGDLFDSSEPNNTSYNNSRQIWMTVLMSGGIIFYASSIFGIVRAITYPISYNNKLKTAINIDQIAIDIMPSLLITENGLNLVLVKMEW